jgi:hypothetical protein
VIARRHLITRAAAAAGLLLAPRVPAARAAFGTLPKAALQYREHPLGEKSCVTCTHFVRAATSGGADHCTVVAGPVSPHGYCLAWAERNPSNSC